MVEEHSPEFVDAGEKQKIDFFDGDVHLGHYDFRFDFNDKKHFSISRDGTGRVRVHSQKNISKLSGSKFVLKAQIHAGGRGKAGGVKLIQNKSELEFVTG